MTYTKDGIGITHLDEMLEGQVAVLSSEFLDGKGAQVVLMQLKKFTVQRRPR